MSPKWKLTHGRCPTCGRAVAAQVPSGGDGSVEVYRFHRTSEGGICPNSRGEVRSVDIVTAAEESTA